MGQDPLCRPKESSPSGRGYVGRIPNLRGRASRVSPLTAPLHPCHGRYNERPAPWTLLYADDIMLASEQKEDLQRQTQAGVHQGSALSPLLFILVMDAITRDLQRPAPWTLLYADDVMLASEQKEDLQRQTQAWSERLARFGLRLNVKKTEYMTTNLDELSTIQVDGNDLRRTDYFKYLGSTLSADGNLAHEVVARVNATWLKWRSMTGVLCDKNIADRFKSKVYRAVVRSVALYGVECWPATKEVERRLSVMETKMLRWTAFLTRADRIHNEKIRERLGIAAIADKLREIRLRWYGHVLRANEDTICKVGLDLEVPGKRPKGDRSNGGLTHFTPT
ncbi:hypothetical protein Y032_0133g1802 [Ancylostoma ceylanicum]|uniref:Reverse transcriptase domain-containing protein n=1 Tax=Ancylostoma ceylanicum TaxID=53326 RepID=A0A016T6M2_9BILA|nr:hypothetical protein Y032_0133g1802 [Ancylostoma ceylanicum]